MTDARRSPAVLGFIALDAVWLDDRQRGRWALRGFDLALTPGTLTALLGGTDDGGPDAVLDLVAGRRLPNKGTLSIDGIDLRDLDRAAHRRAVVELELLPGGERRVCLPNGTMLAVRPTPATISAADVVVTIEDGLLRQ